MEITKEQKLFQEVVNKAWEDASFKAELIADPIAAIEKLTGVQVHLPEEKKIVVRDQTNGNVIYINIPVEPNMEDMELDEAQLEAVAGGQSLYPFNPFPSLVSIDFSGGTGPYNPIPQ